MKILILGAGQVGSSLAGTLSSESVDINVVDTDQGRLAELMDRFDIRTVTGDASHPSTLLKAAAEDTDMMIAVTNSDEINMLACQLGSTLFNIPTKIARVRQRDYLLYKDKLFSDKAIPVDILISPEQLVTEQLTLLLENQGALQVLNFADGAVKIVAIRVTAKSALLGQTVDCLEALMPGVCARIVSVFRNDKALALHRHPAFAVGDEVFVITAVEHTREIIQRLSTIDQPYQKVMIAGGGNIGARFSAAIEHDYQVKLIEYSLERCNHLAKSLSETLIINGSASDNELLRDEAIDEVDFFCAVTDSDETNIMAAMLAKQLGARKVATLINNAAYTDLIQGGVIDIAISPQQATVGSTLAHVRRGDIVKVYPLRQGFAEAMEAIAHGTPDNSKVVGRAIGNIKLPKTASIAAIVRSGMPIMPAPDLVVEDGDHMILFLNEKKSFREVERLFQVGLSFF